MVLHKIRYMIFKIPYWHNNISSNTFFTTPIKRAFKTFWSKKYQTSKSWDWLLINKDHENSISDSIACKWCLHKCSSKYGSRGPLNKHRHTFFTNHKLPSIQFNSFWITTKRISQNPAHTATPEKENTLVTQFHRSRQITTCPDYFKMADNYRFKKVNVHLMGFRSDNLMKEKERVQSKIRLHVCSTLSPKQIRGREGQDKC